MSEFYKIYLENYHELSMEVSHKKQYTELNYDEQLLILNIQSSIDALLSYLSNRHSYIKVMVELEKITNDLYETNFNILNHFKFSNNILISHRQFFKFVFTDYIQTKNTAVCDVPYQWY